MGRLVSIAAGLLILSVYGAEAFPYSWSHRLTAHCNWRPRPGIGLLGSIRQRDEDAQFACWQGHGLKSLDSEHVKEILQKFPSEAELAAWSTAK